MVLTKASSQAAAKVRDRWSAQTLFSLILFAVLHAGGLLAADAIRNQMQAT
jgi:hypothetical protein